MKCFKPMFGLTALLTLIFLAGSGFSASTTNGGPTVKQVKVGQEFTIILPSNPSTGYNWIASLNSQHAKLINHRYQPNYPARLGSGGNEIFTFKAVKSGETTITLNYQRSWEPNPIKIKQYKVKIN